MTSVHWSDYLNTNEQDLVQDLVDEAIASRGVECLYCPRTPSNENLLYHEDPGSRYLSAHNLDLYVKFGNDGFGGDRTLYTMFGYQVSDRLVFTVSTRTFAQTVGRECGLDRPREGDVIYFPLDKRLYTVSFVEKYPVFFQTGALQTWDVSCELLEYTSQDFQTGIAEIDSVVPLYSQNLLDRALLDHEGKPVLANDGSYLFVGDYDAAEVDPLDDAEDVQEIGDEFLDLTQGGRSPFAGGD